MNELSKLRMPVREFASPNMRRGHIDMFSGFRPDLTSGQEIHARVQARLEKNCINYRKEFFLQHELQINNQPMLVTGRVDGIFEGPEQEPVIDEIKTTGSIDGLSNAILNYQEHPYRLQCLTYGYFYWLKEQILPRCQLRLVSNITDEEEIIAIPLSLDWYEEWLDQRLAHLKQVLMAQQARVNNRVHMATDLEFPFVKLRPGQKELVDAVTQVSQSKGQMLVQAPTGLGKTVGVLFPALREALSRGKQTVYLTPKNSQHKLAQEAIDRLVQQGHDLSCTTITAKAKICMQDEPLCTPDHCQYAKNYFDKLSEHRILEKLATHNQLDKHLYRQFAETYQVCPFELNLEMARNAEVVVCDYNYVFSPRNAFTALLHDYDGNSRQANLVIDEAHNLPQRSADYLSPRLSNRYLKQLSEREEELPKTMQPRWRKLLNHCIACVANCNPQSGKTQDFAKFDSKDFYQLEERINRFLVAYFEKIEKLDGNDPVTALQRYWSDFCFALQFDGEAFFSSFETTEEGGILKITCCDASAVLKEKLKFFNATIGFSATLKPFEYFRRLIGFDEQQTTAKEFSSPFPAKNRKLIVIPQVSTKFRDRERNYQKIGDAIGRLIRPKTGNYFVFFPSFDFISRVAPFIDSQGYRLMIQQRNTTPEEADEILAALQEQSKKVLVLGVQGGVFAEGVDYPGDSLIGAIIVGPGLPGYDFEREIIRQYYDDHYDGQGFAFAYVYPGMTKVIQSAGRVIRSEHDRGMIVLMDHRFIEEPYKSVMPDYWYDSSIQELQSSHIIHDLERFWQSHESL